MTDWDEELNKAEQKERAHEERLDRIGCGLERLAAAVEEGNRLQQLSCD